MKHFVLCRLTYGSNSKVETHYNITRVPVIYFLDKRGYSLARAESDITLDNLVKALIKFKQ